MDRRIPTRLVAGGGAALLAWLLPSGWPTRTGLLSTELWVSLEITPLQDALLVPIWLGAAAGAIWLTVSSLAAVAAAGRRIARGAAGVARPVIRRTVGRSTAVLLLASALTVSPVRAGDGAWPAPVDPDGGLLPPALSGCLHEPARSVPGCAAPRGAYAQVAVQPGDHLWAISARHLAGGHLAGGHLAGRRLADREVAPYWRRVIEHNRPRLASGNPDLIYQGEIIELPPADHLARAIPAASSR